MIHFESYGKLIFQSSLLSKFNLSTPRYRYLKVRAHKNEVHSAIYAIGVERHLHAIFKVFGWGQEHDADERPRNITVQGFSSIELNSHDISLEVIDNIIRCIIAENTEFPILGNVYCTRNDYIWGHKSH